MRFASIDGKAVTELEFDLLVNFFVEHAFMKFMDHGRSGVVLAVDDTIDNLETFALARAKSTAEMTINQRLKVREFGQRLMIDEFIRSGSSGFSSAIRSIYQIIYNQVNLNKAAPMDRKLGRRRSPTAQIGVA